VRAPQPMTLAAGAGVLAAVAIATPAAAAPPPCGAQQIADPVGDGHHPNTDVTGAWLSEAA